MRGFSPHAPNLARGIGMLPHRGPAPTGVRTDEKTVKRLATPRDNPTRLALASALALRCPCSATVSPRFTAKRPSLGSATQLIS